MSFEVEIKYRVPDLALIEARLRALGAVPGLTVEERDTYYRHPARDFALTDEVFRLRTQAGRNRLTYKGPKQPGPTKTRREIEIAYEDGPHARAEMADLLTALGFQAVREVAKRRTAYAHGATGATVHVTLDQVEGLGTYVEVEAIADAPEDLATTQERVLQVASQLGLTDIEPRSYLRMALDADQANSAATA